MAAAAKSTKGVNVTMDIGIIGSGQIGSTLARTVAQAARAQDVVIIAVPEKAVAQLPPDILAPTLAIVVDAGNYYPARDGHIAEIDAGRTDRRW